MSNVAVFIFLASMIGTAILALLKNSKYHRETVKQRVVIPGDLGGDGKYDFTVDAVKKLGRIKVIDIMLDLGDYYVPADTYVNYENAQAFVIHYAKRKEANNG